MKNLFLLLISIFFLTSCAALKRHRTETTKTSETAGIFAISKTEFDLLQTSIDVLLHVSGDSLTADFLNDTGTFTKQVESGTMTLQVSRDTAGKLHAKAVTKDRKVPAKQNSTSIKTRAADSSAQIAHHVEETVRVLDKERKALIPDWVWWIGLALLGGFAIYWIWYCIKK